MRFGITEELNRASDGGGGAFLVACGRPSALEQAGVPVALGEVAIALFDRSNANDQKPAQQWAGFFLDGTSLE
jgi:hypothetical protein